LMSTNRRRTLLTSVLSLTISTMVGRLDLEGDKVFG
jgi:hypothetical protein